MTEFREVSLILIRKMAQREAGARHLRLYIAQANGLIKGDIFGLSDPYVKVTIDGRFNDRSRDILAGSGTRTHTVKKSLAPQWNHELDFWIRGDQFSVIFDVYDENILIRDDFLGRQVLHFDFTDTNPDTRPAVVRQTNRKTSRLLGEESIVSAGRRHVLPLKDKYDTGILNSHLHLHHVRRMKDVFRQKQLHRTRDSEPSRGQISIHYIFEDLDAATSDFEIVGASPQPGASPAPTGGASVLGFESLTLADVPSAPPPVATTDQPTATAPTQQQEESEGESSDEEELPTGWERRLDSNGRRLFVNHHHRAVSLRRPRRTDPPATRPVPPRRYLERNTSVDAIEEVEEDDESAEEEGPPSATAGAPLNTFTSSLEVRQALNQPPQPSLLSPNIHATSQQHAAAAVGTASPVHVPATPQFSTALQRANQGLSPGWAASMTPDGRIYYIDHNTYTTTWEKPRVQERRPILAERGANIGPVEQDPDLPDGWEVRKTREGKTYYVNHHTRSTSWEHPRLQQERAGKFEELGPLPSGWEMKQMPDGRIFYMDHTTHSTQWEDPRLLAKNKPTARIQYSRDYKQKYTNFRSKLHPKHRIPNQFDIPMRRSKLFEDSYNVIMNVRDIELLKSRLYVRFEGEVGYDYGGLTREWLYLLSHEMFNPYYGLFEYSASDDYTLQISPESGTYNEHHLDYFKFIGRVCGMAIYHNRLIDAFFIRPFYKMALAKPVTLEDMQSVDAEIYNSFMYILENDPEPLCLDFSINKTLFGEVILVDLKPGGRDIPVTEKNKKEYIDMVIKWRFTDRVQKQMNAIRQGISDLIPLHLLQVFDERELEYLLGGLSQIDVEDWKRNTEYFGYTANDNVIVWFWKAVENYDSEMRARLLQFVTGTSKVPMNGFTELQGSQGPRKFCLKKYGTPDSLPRAHTCFNRIDLPPYPSYHKLKENLKLAVENTEGFAGVD